MYNRGWGIFIILSVLMVLIFYSYKNNILEVLPRKQKTKNIRDSKKKKEKRNWNKYYSKNQKAEDSKREERRSCK